MFAGLGAFGTAVQYITLIILVEWLSANPVFSSTIGFILGAIINYLLSYIIVFKSKKNHSEAFVKFMTVASGGLFLNVVIMHIGTDILKWHYILCQISATGLVLFWNFTLNKIWTFSHRKN